MTAMGVTKIRFRQPLVVPHSRAAPAGARRRQLPAAAAARADSARRRPRASFKSCLPARPPARSLTLPTVYIDINSPCVRLVT
eukprot:747652-Pleurochrysis_carterae.AAC.5